MGENIIDRNRFKLGFELETESMYGYAYNENVSSDTIDEEETKTRNDNFISVNLCSYRDTHNILPALLGEHWRPNSSQMVMTRIREVAIQQGIDLSQKTLEAYRAVIASLPPVYVQTRCNAEYFQRRLDNRFEVERDGTVSGPEIITKGGNTPDKLRELSRYIFAQPLKVNAGCSFHLHLSVDGFDHRYGRSLQRFMVQYILQNMHRVPKSVLHRWIDRNKCNKMQYFTLEAASEQARYAFIAYRSEEYGRKPPTWEFRCWGNIDNLEDASTCIELSIEAYTYAHTQAVLLHKPYTRDWVSVKDAILAKAHHLTDTTMERAAL